jgi:hypothetical protein
MLQDRRLVGLKADKMEPVQLSLMQDSPCLRVKITDTKKKGRENPCPSVELRL